MSAASTVDTAEIARFAAIAAEWWDDSGPMRPLHKLNPTRLQWIKGEICGHFSRPGRASPSSPGFFPPGRASPSSPGFFPPGRASPSSPLVDRDPKAADALSGLRILDVGCGAGILAEPLARMGAAVTAIDPSPELVAAARLHAAGSGLAIDYRIATAEDLAAAGEQYDVVTALEVVEHVTDVPAFVAACGALVKPGGMLVASTINRTMKAYLLAIIGAEYVLRWLPRGTHSYDKLVTPDELRAALTAAGLEPAADTGIMYLPIVDEFRLTRDLDVNYMMTATRA